LAEQVVAANPDALGDVRHMAKASGRAAIIGLVGAHTGDSELLDEAIALHARSVALRRQVLARDPANAQDRRTLADAMIMKSATHDLGQRDLQASLAECREALAILSELAAADASNVEAQQDLSFGQYSTGRISQLLGDVSSAAFHYQESLRILQPLVAANPRNVETAFDHERAQRALQEIAELQRSPDPSYRQPK
jgi:tetratricopeptide (TPR) repeat protein